MNVMSAGLPDDQSPDAQLQLALQLVQQSYTRRQEELTREVEHWKRVAQHHKQQEAQTRDELNKSNQRGQELQQQLNQRNQEVQQLTESRNVALNQIATLKKHAAQLQSFKKNISNMITSESGIDSLSGMQAMVNDLPTMDTTFTSTMTSPALDAFNPRAGYFNANADYAAPSLSTGIAPAPMMSSYAPPAAGTSAAPPSTGTSAPPAAPEVTLDAATYYQQAPALPPPPPRAPRPPALSARAPGRSSACSSRSSSANFPPTSRSSTRGSRGARPSARPTRTGPLERARPRAEPGRAPRRAAWTRRLTACGKSSGNTVPSSSLSSRS